MRPQFQILCLILCLITAVSSGAQDLTLNTRPGGCTATYSPQNLDIDTLHLNGSAYRTVSFLNASPWSDKNGQASYCRTIVIGIPQQGDVRVSVIASDFTQVEGRLAPQPVTVRRNNLPYLIYRESDKHNADIFPQSLFHAEKPEWFGEHRIVRINIFPVQTLPGKNQIRIYSRILLDIQFEEYIAQPGQKDARISRDINPIYKSALANYTQAMKWQKHLEIPLNAKRIQTKNGAWYKLNIAEESIHKITGSALQSSGIDISLIQPSTLKMYNSGGRELPRPLTAFTPDSLVETPIMTVGLEDGRFDIADYLLFYGKGITGWEYNANQSRFEHYLHRYATENTSWLVFNDGTGGMRMTTETPPSQGGVIAETYKENLFIEQDLENPLNGGIAWYGLTLDNNNPLQTYDINLSNPVEGETLEFRVQTKGGNSGSHRVEIAWNADYIHTYTFSSTVLSSQAFSYSGQANNGSNTLSLRYSGTGIAPYLHIDWIELLYRRPLRAVSGKLMFHSDGQGLFDYHMEGFGNEPLIFDVTDPASVVRIFPREIQGGYAFIDTTQDPFPSRYLVFESSAVTPVTSLIKDDMANLRDPAIAADYYIITNNNFMDQVYRLKNHREQFDSLTVQVVDIENVYDDFSWGLKDPVSIRNFIRHAYERFDPRPSYLLLLGDGDYDYRGLLPFSRGNWIPPFEFDGVTESGARSSDDWFTYVSGNDSRMDLAVGRLPVQTEAEAEIVIEKIMAYETSPPQGEWKTLATFIGDDEKSQTGQENEITHTRASELIAELIIPDWFNLHKIYLTEYPEVITAEGRRKPHARDDLVERINEGTLLLNFIGHGNERLWAHERAFQRDIDLSKLHNEDKLPLIYAATCAFGWYDNPKEQSFSEELLNTENKGAIAVISASRFCNAAPNEALNQAFMSKLFLSEGITQRLGDALRLAKLEVSSTTNNEMYHVLGDPAMRLAVPRNRAVITDMEPDSFKALGVIQVEGDIEKNGGSLWTDFSGNVRTKAFDSKKAVTYTTQYGTRLEYKLPGNALYRGENSTANGRFNVSFVVPKDISYGGTEGRISCYFWDVTGSDGAGYRDNIQVGGTVTLQDIEGPGIELGFTEPENFVSGGMVPENPELSAIIKDDSSGINITGEIGHKIILTLDNGERIDITRYFQYDDGSYLKGRLKYPLPLTEAGDHQLSLKVWDNANNSATQIALFELVPDDELRIASLLNYPNPFSHSTHFTFELNRDATVDIKVFTVAGRLVRHLASIAGMAGFNMIPWDGLDEMGDELANGVYIYQVIAKRFAGGEDVRKEELGRLLIIH